MHRVSKETKWERGEHNQLMSKQGNHQRFGECYTENIYQKLKHMIKNTMGLIYQFNIETSADQSAEIMLRQCSHVIHETFV